MFTLLYFTQRLPCTCCHPQKNPLMLRLLVILSAGIMLLSACSKNNNSDESLLYGTWVKGANAGDTLWFMRKDGKNIMRSNQSFNPGLAAYTEVEYSFKDGKLQKVLPLSSSALSGIDSFAWIEEGKKFELLGYQLYMFMSSTATKFAFTKID